MINISHLGLIAAALFDLEASVRFNNLQSCRSGQCMLKKKGKRIEGSLPIQDLQTSSGGYCVRVKDSAKPRDFNPLCIPCDPAELQQQFKAGLLETFPSSSAQEPGQTVEEIRALINNDLNVSKQESGQSVDVYSMSDYADLKCLFLLILKKSHLQSLKNLQLNCLSLLESQQR